MRSALLLIGVLGAHAVQLGVEAGVESEMEALDKLTVNGVQDGKRVLVMVMKALDKFHTKVDAEQEEDQKQCTCRETFMENELIDLCGESGAAGVSACPANGDGGDNMVGTALIGAAKVAVTSAQGALSSALMMEAQAKQNQEEFQSALEKEIQKATTDEEQANKRLGELNEQLADMQALAKALNRAVLTLASRGPGGIDSRPSQLTPGMVPSFVQLQQEVAKEKQANNTYADKLEKQLLAFEVAAGVSKSAGAKAPSKPKEDKKEALVQESSPGRLYLMNDRSELLVGYLTGLYQDTMKNIKELQSGLEAWQDGGAAGGASSRNLANDKVMAYMSTGDPSGSTQHMDSFRKNEIYWAQTAAETRRDLTSKTAQLEQMRTYMRETQMNQVVEKKACSARTAERVMELAAIAAAQGLLQGWQDDEWGVSLVENNNQGGMSFLQTGAEANAEEAEATTTAFETLRQLRTDFETYRAQMQQALNTLSSDWKLCKTDIAMDDEDLKRTTLELAQSSAMHAQLESAVDKCDAAIAAIELKIGDTQTKIGNMSTKRDAQRTANREEAEACESSVAVTHKVIEVLKQHFQNGATGSAVDGISGTRYSDATRSAERTDGTDTSSASNGIQHNERTAEMSAIISSLQKVAFEFEKCGQTVRSTDRAEENAFRRSTQASVKLLQDLSVEKAYEQGKKAVGESRKATAATEENAANTDYNLALQDTQNASYKNCKEAVADFDAERAKLRQKISNAQAVKDLIMVAMQNIKGVPPYPQNCAFEAANQGAPFCDVDASKVTYTWIVETAKTIDGNDAACQMQSVSGQACSNYGDSNSWSCDTQTTASECTCTIKHGDGGPAATQYDLECPEQ